MIGRVRLALRVVAVALGAAVLWLVVAPRFLKPVDEDLASLPELGRVGEFTLLADDGSRFDSSELSGSVWVADFIFTRCRGPCPLITRAMADLEKEAPPDANLRFVTVTVDPGHDTPEVMGTYRRDRGATSARWHFLTGDPAAVRGVVETRFRMPVGDPLDPDDDEIVIPHSEKFVLVDRKGVIRGYFPGRSADGLRRLRYAIGRLLAEEKPLR